MIELNYLDVTSELFNVISERQSDLGGLCCLIIINRPCLLVHVFIGILRILFEDFLRRRLSLVCLLSEDCPLESLAAIRHYEVEHSEAD